VIAVISNGDRCLLGRHNRARSKAFFTALAGFVEPGESAEEAVAREIFEEAGVRVKDVRYFSSQPWPFPHSLMIGFRARYLGGELVLQEDEIAEAGWYGPGELPMVPPTMSIAGRMIEAWSARTSAG
jgi:NAD+ diphosphatase